VSSRRPSLWEDQGARTGGYPALSYLEGSLAGWKTAAAACGHRVLFELADDEHAKDTRDEATGELAALRKDIDNLEVRTLLNGEYDVREALISIKLPGGRSGPEDFAGNLQRMYLRWASGISTRPRCSTSPTVRRASKSTTFAVKAPYAYGRSAASRARTAWSASPKYDNQGRRQTRSRRRGAPVVEQTDHVNIPDDELRLTCSAPPGPAARRQHHGLGGTDHPLAHRHRRLLPERAVADPEQGLGDGGPPGQAP